MTLVADNKLWEGNEHNLITETLRLGYFGEKCFIFALGMPSSFGSK